jgi:SAM-dependent methyltransferase
MNGAQDTRRHRLRNLGRSIFPVLLVLLTSVTTYLVMRSPLLSSTLPDVSLAERAPVTDAYQKAYAFSDDWFTEAIPVWEKALEEFRGEPDIHYLEIGVFEGRSVIWALENILTHPTARLTGIDPFIGDFKNTYVQNIARTGMANKVTTIEGFSQEALRGLPLASFDIVYIDGSHAADDVLEDAVLSWRLLKEGGILIFDDYLWGGNSADFPFPAINVFHRFYGHHFDVIHNGYQVILKKLPVPDVPYRATW